MEALKDGEGCVKMGERNRDDQEESGRPIPEGIVLFCLLVVGVVVDGECPVSEDSQGRMMSS